MMSTPFSIFFFGLGIGATTTGCTAYARRGVGRGVKPRVGRQAHWPRRDTEMPFAYSVARAALVEAVPVVVRVEPQCLIVQRFPTSRAVRNATALPQNALLPPPSLPPPNKTPNNRRYRTTVCFRFCSHTFLLMVAVLIVGYFPSRPTSIDSVTARICCGRKRKPRASLTVGGCEGNLWCHQARALSPA